MKNVSTWTEFATLEGDRALSYQKEGNKISILYAVPYDEINIYSEDESGNEIVVGLEDDLLKEVEQAVYKFVGTSEVYLSWGSLNESNTICECTCYFEI